MEASVSFFWINEEKSFQMSPAEMLHRVLSVKSNDMKAATNL